MSVCLSFQYKMCDVTRDRHLRADPWESLSLFQNSAGRGYSTTMDHKEDNIANFPIWDHYIEPLPGSHQQTFSPNVFPCSPISPRHSEANVFIISATACSTSKSSKYQMLLYLPTSIQFKLETRNIIWVKSVTENLSQVESSWPWN